MKTFNSYLLLLFFLTNLVNSTMNRSRINPLLDRRKRFLSFPKGTNLVINLTLVKSLLRDFPPINMLLECDVPFPLPSKEDYVREKHDYISPYIPVHFRQRRQIYLQLENAFTALGVDGSRCLQRFICEVDTLATLHPHGNLLVIEMLRVIFDLTDFDKYYGNYFENKCSKEIFEKCVISFLDLFLRSLGTWN